MLDLSLEVREEKVKINGEVYTLREASGEAARAYKNALMSGAKLDDGKVVGFGGMADAEPLLVSKCLFDSNDKPVPLQVVKGWRAKVVEQLFNVAKKISELDEEETTVASIDEQILKLQEQRAKLVKDEAGNGPTNSTDGSD